MSQYSKISQVAHYLPSRVVTNDDLSEILDTSDEWIRERTGIGERRVSQGETTSQMAVQVAESLLVKADLEADQLDFIIVATMSPDSMMPSTAAQVQAAIGASRAFAFDVTAACSGFVYALSLADKLICSNAYQKGLVIGAEVISKMLDWTDRSTAVLFGDGAGGVLLESTQEKHFLGESLWTDGTRAKALTAGSKAVTSPFSEGASESAFLQMNGRSVFDFATKDVPKNISQLLASLDLQVDEVDYYLLHQANSRILDKVARKIAVDRDKFLSNLMHYGNTSAASIPILLSESVDKGLLKLDGSQTVLLSGFGGGLTWGSIIVKL